MIKEIKKNRIVFEFKKFINDCKFIEHNYGQLECRYSFDFNNTGISVPLFTYHHTTNVLDVYFRFMKDMKERYNLNITRGLSEKVIINITIRIIEEKYNIHNPTVK